MNKEKLESIKKDLIVSLYMDNKDNEDIHNHVVNAFKEIEKHCSVESISEENHEYREKQLDLERAKAVMRFANMMVNCYAIGDINVTKLLLTDIYQTAKSHVDNLYGVNTPHFSRVWGDDLYDEILDTDKKIPILEGVTSSYSENVKREIESHNDIKENFQYIIQTKNGDKYVGVISPSFYWKKFKDREFWCLHGIHVDGGDFREFPNIVKIPVEEVTHYKPLFKGNDNE